MADTTLHGEVEARNRRRLRAVFAADMANYGGLVAIDETRTIDELWEIRKAARDELAAHGGWLFGLPGDGIFALFESAIDAVHCGLVLQTRLTGNRRLSATRLRVGIHLGEVLFRDEVPFGEALVIAARLEGLADPGGILVSSAVMDAVSQRISATFTDRGVQSLKHSPRRVATFAVALPAATPELPPITALDRTIRFRRHELAGHQSAAGQAPPTSVPGPRLLVPPLQAAPAPAPALDDTLPAAPRQSEAYERINLPAPVAPRTAGGPPVALLPIAVSSASLLPLLGTAVGASRAEGLSPPPEAEPPPSASRIAIDAAVSKLTAMLVPHIGPVASIMVRRHALKAESLEALIEVLAGEIPVPAERNAFLTVAAPLKNG